MLKHFLSSNKKRINYIKIIYGINIEELKITMINSLNLISKLKDKNESEEEEIII